MPFAELAVVKVFCTDLERSQSFYDKLGYRVERAAPPRADRSLPPPEDQLYGVPGVWVRESILAQPGNPKAGRICLFEWSDAKPASGPNTFGGALMAFTTENFDDDVAAFRAAGIPFLTEPRISQHPLGGTAKVAVIQDPDGFCLQFSQHDPNGRM